MQEMLYKFIRKYIYPHWIKQDVLRYLFFVPLIAVAFFIATVIIVLYILHSSQLKNQNSLIYRDLPWLNHKIYSYTINNEQQIKNIAQSLQPFFYDDAAFQELSRQYIKDHNDIVGIYRLNNQHQVMWSLPSLSIDLDDAFNSVNDKPRREIILKANKAKNDRKVVYYTLQDINKQNYIILQLPLYQGEDFIGSLSVIYSPIKLMANFTNYDLIKNYQVILEDNNSKVWFSSNNTVVNNDNANNFKIPFSVVPSKLNLKAIRYNYANNFFNNSLIWIIIILSTLIIWSLLMLWRYMLRSRENQKLLLNEIAFRKSMGDSILVGMRAIDMQGKIIYVNPAFCHMTGFKEYDLLDSTAPFLYWPQSDYDDLFITYNNLLKGNTPSKGIDLRLQKKDGSIFYVRMHACELMDGKGTQIGWLSSIVDVTEPKRAKEELAAAHRRFMTVIESLEAGVSVVILENNELLFSNRYYKQLFGNSNHAHLYLSKSPTEKKSQLTAMEWLTNILPSLYTDNHYEEIYYPNNKKWFNIKTYPIQWVDGRIAQMMVAIDVTQTKIAQEQAKINEEKWHFANRLSNMGEMASSIAHEINQPLTAISNYCNGILERAKQEHQPINPIILQALEKASYQALKAGDIIKRLRNFVSKSQPKKNFEDIKSLALEAIALVNFSNNQNNIKLNLDIKENLPDILIDKVLIEQVLVNLLRNAIEANILFNQINNTSSTVTLKIFLLCHETELLHKYLHIYVIDEGVGISADIKDKIFDAFFTTKNDGMGMGLNICRSIIENHQGTLNVENNPQKGCTFKIILPLY